MHHDQDLGHPKWTALHGGYAPAVQQLKEEIGIDLGRDGVSKSWVWIQWMARSYDIEEDEVL
eukprot:3877504-Amphidinium_carterae.1